VIAEIDAQGNLSAATGGLEAKARAIAAYDRGDTVVLVGADSRDAMRKELETHTARRDQAPPAGSPRIRVVNLLDVAGSQSAYC
jgi:hypothetical protein